MELLERDAPLAALSGARASAASGRGRVAFVSGEPGIGKTALVARFLRDLDERARVLVGTCDDLSIPRPLGPLRDLAGDVAPALAQALAHGAAPHEIQSLLIAELERVPRPTVLVLEDVHWADAATLDTITVLGRRIGALPALLILTFRGGEAPAGHALRTAVGAIRADESVVLDLTPLSRDAVASLAGDQTDALFAATAGNPFYLTELLASRDASELPASIANAVLGRASRLDAAGRRLVELVSVVPSRVRTLLLDALQPDWTLAAEEPERRQLLDVGTTHVRFRHELARHAVRSSLPLAAQRRLHGEIVGALLASGAEAADIVHHAEAAGAQEVVAGHALVAARQAAALHSTREAFSHYRRALDFIDRLAPVEQAAVLEELAETAYLLDRLDDAFLATERARATYVALGDLASVGRLTWVRSRLHWSAGDGVAARATGLEAVAILEPLGRSVELARAYGGLSQLAMLADDHAQTVVWGDRELELAVALGDEPTRAHALVNLGTMRVQVDPADTGMLLEAFAVADTAGDVHEATRALVNLAYSLLRWVEPVRARVYADQAVLYAEQHEVHNLGSYLTTLSAWLQLRAGEWEQAEPVLRSELGRGSSVPQLLAKLVLCELAVRRGDDDAAELLVDLVVQADRTGEPQRTLPVLEIATESALLHGSALPRARFERLVELGAVSGQEGMRIPAWAALADLEIEYEGAMPEPLDAMRRRDWSAAADAFGELGWSYDRALMLSLLDGADELTESIAIARRLGAAPLVRRVAERMRERGMRIPQGPRETTRSNPAGLTARQLEVLALVADGLTNAEIAERLTVSPRTAEHHVAAVLGKLGATTRRQAARRAKELQI